MDKFFELLDKAIEIILDLLMTPVAELRPIEFMAMLGVGVAIFYFVKYGVKAFIKYGAKGAQLAYKPINKGYRAYKRHRQHKRICPVCKNPLHKCTCPDNKGVPYRIRLKKWRKQQKHIRQVRKQKELEQKLKNLPIDTYTRGKDEARKKRIRGGR